MLDRLLDKSLIGYTSLGYRLRSLGAVEADLRGRVAVVTGATYGLGKATATELARLGATVRIVGRNRDKAAAVRTAIMDAHAHADVTTEIADLSLMAEVRDLATRLEGPIHLLVNNAGVLLPTRTETTEGLETTFATNLLGHFVLTNLLAPTLARSAPARVVNVSSGGMYTQGIAVRDLQMSRTRYDGAIAYARTKRGQVVLTQRWARALSGRGVTVHAMHPGWADTPGVESSLPRFHAITKPLLRTSEEGADTIVWLCTAREGAETTGLFWHDRRPRPIDRSTRTKTDQDTAEALWDALEALSGGTGFPASLDGPSAR
ncbi:MAG: SDR family NAD(P)-dependent oxidoreductase [Myxococcota bacterium]